VQEDIQGAVGASAALLGSV